MNAPDVADVADRVASRTAQNLAQSAGQRPLAVLCAGFADTGLLASHLGQSEVRYAAGRGERRIWRAIESFGGQRVAFGGNEYGLATDFGAVVKGDFLDEHDLGAAGAPDTPTRVMAFFQDGEDAFRSALEMQNRVAELPPVAGIPLALQIGVCAGHDMKEERFFPFGGPNPGLNPAVCLASVAEPDRILLSVPRRNAPLPWVNASFESVTEISLQCGLRQLDVFEAPWRTNGAGSLQTSTPRVADDDDAKIPPGTLRVATAGSTVDLGLQQSILTIGRQPDCDVVIRGSFTSREHGRIERRGERFIFIDHSANGSFVRFDNPQTASASGSTRLVNVYVHRRELLLFGSGRISLGGPGPVEGVASIRFHIGR